MPRELSELPLPETHLRENLPLPDPWEGVGSRSGGENRLFGEVFSINSVIGRQRLKEYSVNQENLFEKFVARTQPVLIS